MRERYALEVSSPGPRAPADQARRTSPASSAAAPACARSASHDGHKSFTGELVGATDAEVTIAADDRGHRIPYDDIPRSNLVEE